jgi:hypothetical protein
MPILAHVTCLRLKKEAHGHPIFITLLVKGRHSFSSKSIVSGKWVASVISLIQLDGVAMPSISSWGVR